MRMKNLAKKQEQNPTTTTKKDGKKKKKYLPVTDYKPIKKGGGE